MKIIFLFPHFISPGGAANVVLQFAKALQLRKYEVEICCATVSKEFREKNPDVKFTELKIPASHSGLYWFFLPLWQIRINRQLNAYKDCILFPHVLPSNWWAWIYKRTHKKAKVVWYCHEPSAFIHSPAWINAIPHRLLKRGAKIWNPVLKKMDRALEKENDLVICNSNFTKEQYERIYGRKADAVIYPPCSVKTVLPENNRENFILTVGRLSKFKSVDRLIEVFGQLLKALPESRLVIAGDGEEREKLMQLTVRLGLKDRVCFKGTVSDEQLAGLYQKARVTVICAHEEPFGLVPIESMMNATPVIAHNSGGPKETIRLGRTGFLYNNEAELAQLITAIFQMDDARYVQMQQDCVKEAARYDISNSIAELERAFQMVYFQKEVFR